MATIMTELMPAVPKVRLLKAQLFQALEKRERDAWKTYWVAFQRYLLAQWSLQEFHDLALALLGPDLLDLHNAFVLALLESASGQDACDNEAASSCDADGSGAQVKSEESRENDHASAIGRPLSIAVNGSEAQESKQLSRKRSFTSTALSPHSIDARDVKAMLHFAHNSDRSLHADEQSAQLLVGLGKAHAANGASISSPNAKRAKQEVSQTDETTQEPAISRREDIADALATIQDVTQM